MLNVTLLLVATLLVSSCTSSKIHLDPSNKFRDMLVYVNDDIPEGDGSLLRSIKEHIEKASWSLWRATEALRPPQAGVQFGTVFIRIPQTWAAAANAITWQQCNKADFYVTSNRDNNNKSEPYTKQLGKCGEPASFTKFPEGFFSVKSGVQLLRAGRVMMTEFVKLRYGVFSERPYGNMLAVFNGFKFINSTCGPNVQWEINLKHSECLDKNKKCKYKILPGQNHSYSVMFDQTSSQSEFFCNDHDRPHNRYAQSLHNIKCKRQSVSTVILKHADFSTKKTSLPFVNVNFEIVKGQDRRIALVLDVSGSMKSIIDNMRKACVEFIRDVIEDSAVVGLAIFSTTASIVYPPQKMTKANRQSLISIITSLQPDLYTNIPFGLAKGVEILGGTITNDAKLFGTIILLSDGGNNAEIPYPYHSTIETIIRKGVVVNTICYGNLADASLNGLATRSGGKYLFVDPSKPYTDLMKQFAATHSCEKSVHQIKMIEDSIVVMVKGSFAEVNLTYIDKHIGKDIMFTVTFDKDISNYEISLVLPSGRVLKPIKTIVQSSGTTLTFGIPGKVEVGMYKIQTKSKNSLRFKRSPNEEHFAITFTVSATPEAKAQRIINPSGDLSSSEIEVLNDDSFIKATIDITTCGITDQENVTVNLTMTDPLKRVHQMAMTDDGLGDDNIADDKIYTRTLIAKQLSVVGFYDFLANMEILNTVTGETIKRTVELGSMRVKALSSKPIQDKVPPAKIEDINVVVVSSEKKLLNVEIQTTGDDGMLGNISDYEVKVRSHGEELIIKKKVFLVPRIKTTLKLDLYKDNITNPFDISVRGVDAKLNAGEWSLSSTSNWKYQEIKKVFALQTAARKGASATAPILLAVFSASTGLLGHF